MKNVFPQTFCGKNDVVICDVWRQIFKTWITEDHSRVLAMKSLVCLALLDLQPPFIIFTDTVQTLPVCFHFTIWLLSKHIYPHTNRHMSTPPHTRHKLSRCSHVLFTTLHPWQIVIQSGIYLWIWGNKGIPHWCMFIMAQMCALPSHWCQEAKFL